MDRFKRLAKTLVIFLVLIGVLVAWSLWQEQEQKRGPRRPRLPGRQDITEQSVLHKRPTDVQLTALTKNSSAVDKIRAARGKNIIVCVIDAARADHLGYYGYPRATTPNIDRLASESLVFDRHYCQYPNTLRSTISLFTSHYFLPERKPSKPTSMIEWLRYAGFHTLLFTATPNVSAKDWVNGGFDKAVATYNIDMPSEAELLPGHQEQSSDDFYNPKYLLKKLNDWVETKPQQPFFAYIHFVPPHYPYAAPNSLKRLFKGQNPPGYWQALSAMPGRGLDRPPVVPGVSPEEVVNLYDANLVWADQAVGELEKMLQEAGLFDNTLFIVTADHGEALSEHQYNWHTYCPYDEALHIPLIMHFPAGQGPTGKVEALTQTIDLLPSLLDLCEAPYPAAAQGRSFLPVMAGQTPRLHEYIFATVGGETEELPNEVIVRDLQTTLMLFRDGETRALYDTAKDPHQTRNLINDEPKRAAPLAEAFHQLALAQPDPPLLYLDPNAQSDFAQAPPPPKREMPEAMKRQLKTLGYLK